MKKFSLLAVIALVAFAGLAANASAAEKVARDGGFALTAIQVKDDGLGDIGGVVRIKNVSGKTAKSMSFTITFFKGKRIVGTAIGVISGLRPGQTKTATLLSSDPIFRTRVKYQFQVDYAF